MTQINVLGSSRARNEAASVLRQQPIELLGELALGAVAITPAAGTLALLSVISDQGGASRAQPGVPIT